MSDKVKLKKVTADNWEAVVELELRGSQEDLVASNLYSVAEAQFDPDARRRLPDVRRAENEGQGEGSLDLSLHDRSEAPRQRLWSHGAEQGSGGGPRAIPGVNRISIRYTPKNPVAKPFYASFSFVEVGRNRDGEVIAVLKL